MLKKLFGKGDSSTHEERDLTVEDLIVLERWSEAVERLQARVKSNPRDLHAHLKLADVYVGANQGRKALDQYLLVADTYTEEGFLDKAVALLTKIVRLAPNDDSIQIRLAKLQRLKELEHSRVLALEGLLSGQADQGPLARLSPIEAQQIWQTVAGSDLVKLLPGEQLKRLFAGAALTVWEKDELVGERESRIERMFLVVRGQVEAIVALPDGRTIQLRVLKPGDLFGERALLEHRPWPATFRVLERSRLLRIDRAGLEKALAGNPDPRQLLTALRSQHHDRDLATAAEKVLTSAV